MKKYKPIMCCMLLLCMQLGAQIPSVEAEAWAYQYSSLGKTARIAWQDFARLSLYASGVDLASPSGRQYEESLIRAVNQFLSMKDIPSDSTQRGEYILSYLYKTILRSYSERQTKVDTALNTGIYNCVSSAVLYTTFAIASGLDVRGVLTHDHAFVTLNVGNASSTNLIDIETTNEYGFNPGSKKEFHDSFGNTGFVYSEPGNYKDRIAISSFELVSLILTNRISELDTRVFESLPLAANRAALLSQRTNPVNSPLFTDPQADFFDRIMYSANTFGRSGQNNQMFQMVNRAFVLAQQMLNTYPADVQWEERSYVALDTLLTLLLNNQQIAQARQTLLSNIAFVNTAHYAALDARVLDGERWLVENELVQKLNAVRSSSDAEAALDSINEAASKLTPSRIAELRNALLVQQANLIMQEKGFREAIVFAEKSLVQYGKNAALEKNLQVYRSNRVIELHNTFADLWNSGNYSTASTFIQDALREFPNNRQLQQDKSISDRRR